MPAASAALFNVLYIVVDDLRPDISPYRVQNAAAARTPNFERLAATGTVFEQAFVQQAVCGPSRNSFLSGRRPDRTAVWNFIDDCP
jgi:iduronate 2-sulfatase